MTTVMMTQISHTVQHETSNTLHQSLKLAPVLKEPNTTHDIGSYVNNSRYDDDDDDATTALLCVLFVQ
jgi:hypothetical protein